MNRTHPPLSGPPPSEVPLASAPLVRVIAQVRFPMIASVERREFIAPFQEAIRKEYAVLRQEQSRNVVLGGQGIAETHSTTIWRFLDTSSSWTVTLAPEFVALQTSRYTSRDDFLDRFRRILEALEAHIDPGVVDRLGVRYIDRVEEEHLADLPQLVRPEVSGILGTPLFEHARHSLSESLLDLPDGSGLVKARWGLMPSGGTVDPAALEPVEGRSWLLDLDAFKVFENAETELDVDGMLSRARTFAERIYSIFRWTVTDEFLRRYGGRP